MAPSAADDETWRVLILPGLETGKGASIKSFTLPEPKTGRPQGFLLVNGMLLEMNRYKQAFGAWLTGERLLADGGVFLATPYDPLFVLLPILERGRDQDESCPAGKFKELEELLYDSTAPGLGELLSYARASASSHTTDSAPTEAAEAAPQEPLSTGLCPPQENGSEGKENGGGDQSAETRAADEPGSSAAASSQRGGGGGASFWEPPLEQQLACICDLRKVDEQCFFRLNDERVLAWLVCKFRQMQKILAGQVAGLDEPHALSYVLSYLGEYVPDPWVSRLAKHLGIHKKTPSGPTTLQPTDANAQGAGAAQAHTPPALAGPPEKRQKVDPRAVAKQAALAKQAVGTKKLTSFFTSNKK